MFSTPFRGRYVRIYPSQKIDSTGLICLKVELIGCPAVGMLYSMWLVQKDICPIPDHLNVRILSSLFIYLLFFIYLLILL